MGRNELKNNMFNDEEKMCPFCNDSTEDEAHFLLECDLYHELRKKYIEKYITYMNTMGLTVAFLIDGQGYLKTKSVAMFIHYAMRHRRQCLESVHEYSDTHT